MPLRILALFGLASLLLACASETPPTALQTATLQPKAAPSGVSANLPTISGTLLDVPANSEVELALLTVNERGLPQKLLSNIQLQGTGAPLPFRLNFNPASPLQGNHLELRGRVHQSGQLLLHVPNRRILQLHSQSIGEVHTTRAL